MIDRLEAIRKRYETLTQRLAAADIWDDPEEATRLSREQSELEAIVLSAQRLSDLSEELKGADELRRSETDPEMRELAEAEVERLSDEQQRAEQELRRLLLPKDPSDDKDVIVEIRSGAGGDEAALFAADLYRMYLRFAERQGWRAETLDESSTDIGGLKEVVFGIRGERAYSRLKFESGVHRVQRVPDTEAQGRIHTSTVTVAVLPEAEDVEVNIASDELRVDTFRSGGAGGQHVNKTESAVRITHLPTGITVICQDEKSQHKNRDKAMRVLRARLLDHMQSEAKAELDSTRRSQVGSGDRSERIRTYNFPQGRVTDHRIGFTTHRLPGVLDGDLIELIDALTASSEAQRLEGEGA